MNEDKLETKKDEKVGSVETAEKEVVNDTPETVENEKID